MIFQCIIIFQSQSFEFVNVFAQADIPRGEQVFIGSTGDVNSNGGQCNVVLRLKKIIYVQPKSSRLWYEKLLNGLLYCSFVVINAGTFLFVYKTVTCVAYVNSFIFWERSQYDIDKFINSFKEYRPNYNWGD